MIADKLRSLYIEFFVKHGHAHIAGHSLIPENDPTVLFTTAGMHPLVPYILGEDHPAGKRLVNCQRCIRTGDIDEVGDQGHLTFFEMLGNWSLGDYFKEEAIEMSWRFLTEWLHIDPARLAVTVFAGDEGRSSNVPRDEESADIWKKIGIPAERIHYLPRADNWWGPAGQTGPCGPDTEMFIDSGSSGTHGAENGIQSGRYLEIWNDVFMQYNKKSDGTYIPLDRRCVDTGMGLERTLTILQGKQSVFDTELFIPIILALQEHTNARYGNDETVDRSIRIICDHIKSAVFIIGDECPTAPSNLGQGYILRRLIRRAVRYGRKLEITQEFLYRLVGAVVDIYRSIYPMLASQQERIEQELRAEEQRFVHTLQKGEREFIKLLPNLERNPKRIIPGRVAFRLYDTYGFPIEITKELAAEHGFTVDEEQFETHFRAHKEASKSTRSTFKGGLADASIATTRLHTATHLLHQALRDVLGDHIAQRGSNITAERLRFDFSHPAKIDPDQLRRIEEIVNHHIHNHETVSCEMMPLKQARELGAIALFGERYSEMVKVYRIGDYSMEVCGGPHVENTGEIGSFRIVKEQSSSQGVRRIKAVIQDEAETVE